MPKAPTTTEAPRPTQSVPSSSPSAAPIEDRAFQVFLHLFASMPQRDASHLAERAFEAAIQFQEAADKLA